MKEKSGHSHRYDKHEQRSTSQPGASEKSVDKNTLNDDEFSGLVTKTSEIDQLTARTIHKDFRYAAVWIGLAVIAGMILFYFFLF